MVGQQPDYRPRRVHGGGGRRRLAVLVAAVVAVVVVGLVIGYTLLGRGSSPDAAPGAGVATSPGTAAAVSGTETAVLTDDLLLGAATARRLDPGRGWKVALTSRGRDENSPQPACLGADPAATGPAPSQTALRLLSSSGKNAPSVLQQASAYVSPEEAAQAYRQVAATLGGCQMAGASIESAAHIGGLGDQALGLVVRVVQDSVVSFHTLVLSRTGRVVDVVDVAAPRAPIPMRALAGTVAAVTDAQCQAAGGRCADRVAVASAPPPAGGDQPGFLVPADLPVVGRGAPAWVGDQPGPPDADFSGSQCETVAWTEVRAEQRTARTYLQQDGRTAFGLDEIVLTLADGQDAEKLVQQLRRDLTGCEDRKLTASVQDLDRVAGTGARGTPVRGWATTVSQKTENGTARYRVGFVAAGSRLVYTFLNPQPGLDVSDAQWRAVTVRAGQRATQAP